MRFLFVVSLGFGEDLTQIWNFVLPFLLFFCFCWGCTGEPVREGRHGSPPCFFLKAALFLLCFSFSDCLICSWTLQMAMEEPTNQQHFKINQKRKKRIKVVNWSLELLLCYQIPDDIRKKQLELDREDSHRKQHGPESCGSGTNG